MSRMERNSEFLHQSPGKSRKFILEVDRDLEFAGYNPDTPLTMRCGLCGWTKETTRRDMPGLHAKHREEHHAA